MTHTTDVERELLKLAERGNAAPIARGGHVAAASTHVQALGSTRPCNLLGNVLNTDNIFAAGTTVGDVCAPFWPEVARAIKPAPPVDAGADAGADAGVDATLEQTAVNATGGGCAYGRASTPAAAPLLLVLAALVRRGILSMRPRLPWGRSDRGTLWPSASPSRSSS